MFSRWTNNTYINWSLSGGLLLFAFIHPALWFLFLPAVWLFMLAFQAENSLRRVFLGTWLCGSLKAAGGIAWFWQVYPLDWLGLEPGLLQLSLIGLYWFITAVVIGLGLALVFLVYKLFDPENYWLLLMPGVWVLGEVLGSFLFSIYSLGPGGQVNIKFSFGYLGYLLAEVPYLVELAQLGGVYILGLGAVFLVINCYLFYKLNLKLITSLLFLGLFCLVIGVQYFSAEQKKSDLVINNIDTNFSGLDLSTELGLLKKEQAVVQLVEEALAEEVDVIVLPEDSRFTLAFPSTEYALQFVLEHSQGRLLTVVDSARVIDERGLVVLRAFIYDTKTQTVSTVDKQYLVPQGEFVPYLHGWFISLLAGEEFKQSIANIEYVPGQRKNYQNVPDHVPPILFCFESVSPFGVRDVIRQRQSPVVLHVISHAWFNEPDILWFNLERMLKVQAVWNDVTIIEAANLKESHRYTP